MSYDLQVWGTRPIENLQSILPDPTKWVLDRESHYLRGRGWQIVVTGPEKVEDEDIPDDVRPALAGIGSLYSINLEPIGAPATALKSARAAAKAIAAAAHGAAFDPQTEEVTLPTGVRRYTPPRRETATRFDLVSMGWWFINGPLSEPGGYTRFVDLLERLLPDALPRRYGEHEPPQHKLVETGREHFTAYLAEARGDLVWYPTKPVVSVHVGCSLPSGWQPRLGFRAHSAEVEIDAFALSQAGWAGQLLKFWKEMSAFLKPFYGEARILGGNIASGATCYSDSQTEEGPTKSWFWRGIPRNPGFAVVLGEPYSTLWPGFARHSEHKGDLHLLTLPEWKKGRSIVEVTGAVPDELAQRWTPELAGSPQKGWSMRWNTQYPSVFPFGIPPEGCVESDDDF
jgi:hypothetical protein